MKKIILLFYCSIVSWATPKKSDTQKFFEKTYFFSKYFFFKTKTKTLELYLGQKFRNWGEKTIEEELEWIYNPDREGFSETDFNKELERIFGN